MKAPLKNNVENFVNELVRIKIFPVAIPFTNFSDVFSYLSSLNMHFNIVIDEYPYLKEVEDAKFIDSQFQSIIDNNLKNIHLFISGSRIGMMKDMLDEKNALYGRFSLILQLKELNYKESSQFYQGKSIYEKIAFYSVFGGSPFINSFIDQSESLKNNIINTILNQSSPIYYHVEHLLISDYSNTINAERIMFAISNGNKKYSEIENKLNMENNGLLSKQLASLINMDIIAKNFPINKQNDNKKCSYELCDNLLRFYYAYVYNNKSALNMLGAEAFYGEFIEKSLLTFISHRFEEICRLYFSMQVKSGKMHGITNIGTYFYNDSKSHTNGEFEVVLQHRDTYDVFEVKYCASPLCKKDIEEEAQKIRNIQGITLGKIGLISISGFDVPEAFSGNYELIGPEALYN